MVLFMSGIWWGPNPLKPFSKQLKAYEKRKDQKFLDAHDGVVPVTIEFKDEDQERKSEYIQFVPWAVGHDPSFRGIPEAKRSPLDDPEDEEEEEEDESSDESEEDEDDG